MGAIEGIPSQGLMPILILSTKMDAQRIAAGSGISKPGLSIHDSLGCLPKTSIPISPILVEPNGRYERLGVAALAEERAVMQCAVDVKNDTALFNRLWIDLLATM